MSVLLEVRNLSRRYVVRSGMLGAARRTITALSDVSLTVARGETVGLVGESGCGKSTVALGIMQDLGRNGRITGGTIRFRGRDLTAMSEPALRRLRGSEIAMVYQEPMASLNPAMTVGRQLMEVPMVHEGIGRAEASHRRIASTEEKTGCTRRPSGAATVTIDSSCVLSTFSPVGPVPSSPFSAMSGTSRPVCAPSSTITGAISEDTTM